MTSPRYHAYVHPLGEASNQPNCEHVARVLGTLFGVYLGAHVNELGPLLLMPSSAYVPRLSGVKRHPTPNLALFWGHLCAGRQDRIPVGLRYHSVDEAVEKLQLEGLFPELPCPCELLDPSGGAISMDNLLTLACYSPETLHTVYELGQALLHRARSTQLQGLILRELDTSTRNWAVAPWDEPEAKAIGRLGFIATGLPGGRLHLFCTTPWFLQREART